jgi:methionine-rich copper-binding protein CopC
MEDALYETITQALTRQALTDPMASSRQKNLAVVHVYRSDIETALADGWSILATWRVMSADGRVTSTYQSFRKYVNRFILEKTPPIRQRK